MRNRRAQDVSEAIGTDAFLDIVANLVGILLILIMVIGVRMDGASQTARQTRASLVPELGAPEAEPEPPPIEVPDVAPARQEVARLETSIREAELEAAKLEQLTRVQKLDRDNLMLAVSRAEQELEQRRSRLDQQQQRQLEVQWKLQTARAAHDDVIEQLESAKLAAESENPNVIQHVATPLAKTVFAREEHFRLRQGRLVFVPLNEMIEQLRGEAPKKMWKLENAARIGETIGPRDGFLLRYWLRRRRVPVSTGAGLVTREVVELDRFVMVPDQTLTGETVEAALEPNSAFRQRLAGWRPHETIITVWTYPDSFREFRVLKRALYDLGFLTAARPLPADQLISGSPQGTRSAAQ